MPAISLPTSPFQSHCSHGSKTLSAAAKVAPSDHGGKSVSNEILRNTARRHENESAGAAAAWFAVRYLGFGRRRSGPGDGQTRKFRRPHDPVDTKTALFSRTREKRLSAGHPHRGSAVTFAAYSKGLFRMTWLSSHQSECICALQHACCAAIRSPCLG